MARVPWPMTSETYRSYLDLLDQMARAAQASDQLAYEQARDQFRALPGMPQGLNQDLDLVVPVIQDTGHTIISIGSKPKFRVDWVDEPQFAGLSKFIHPPESKPRSTD